MDHEIKFYLNGGLGEIRINENSVLPVFDSACAEEMGRFADGVGINQTADGASVYAIYNADDLEFCVGNIKPVYPSESSIKEAKRIADILITG